MPLTNFNLVLVGDNFPVSSIKIADFQYRHRALKEILRVPVAVQAENELVSMQVLPDRFEATVKTPDDLDIQTAGLQELVATFLEYAGKRTISAVGHNARWTIPDSQEIRTEIAGAFLNSSVINEIVGTDSLADIAIAFEGNNGGVGRLVIPGIANADVVLEFNFHFDLSTSGDPAEVAARIRSSLAQAVQLSERVESVVARVRA